MNMVNGFVFRSGHIRFSAAGKVDRGNFVASKKPHDSGRKTPLRPAQALRFRIDTAGELRAAVSASSGEFNLTPEIIELLCLLQKGAQPPELENKLRARFRKISEELPDSNEIASLLEDLEDARCLVRATPELAPKGLQDGFGDAWIQWAMLADAPRCQAYQAAIREALTEDSHVLDVGAGSGLLSLYALEAGAKKVDAIEETGVAHSLKLLRDKLPDDLRKRMQIHNCNSFDARIPSQITHVVSELFGNDPLQEGVIPTLRNIFSRIQAGRISAIPENFTVFVQLVDFTDGPLHKRLGRFAERNSEQGKAWFGAVERIKSTLNFRDVSFAHMIRPTDIKKVGPNKKAFSIPLAPPPPENAPQPTSSLKLDVEENAAAPALLIAFRAQLSRTHSISNIPGEKDCCEHWSPLVVPLNRAIQSKESIQVRISVGEQWERVTAQVSDASGKYLGSRE
jgi:hypothetical protein